MAVPWSLMPRPFLWQPFVLRPLLPRPLTWLKTFLMWRCIHTVDVPMCSCRGHPCQPPVILVLRPLMRRPLLWQPFMLRLLLPQPLLWQPL